MPGRQQSAVTHDAARSKASLDLCLQQRLRNCCHVDETHVNTGNSPLQGRRSDHWLVALCGLHAEHSLLRACVRSMAAMVHDAESGLAPQAPAQLMKQPGTEQERKHGSLWVECGRCKLWRRVPKELYQDVGDREW